MMFAILKCEVYWDTFDRTVTGDRETICYANVVQRIFLISNDSRSGFHLQDDKLLTLTERFLHTTFFLGQPGFLGTSR